jgi:hypothetical protein
VVTPGPGERVWIEDSSVVASAMYDEAASRILVWEHTGTRWIFEDCSEEMWRIFIASSTSRGEYLRNVLQRHRHRVERLLCRTKRLSHIGIRLSVSQTTVYKTGNSLVLS